MDISGIGAPLAPIQAMPQEESRKVEAPKEQENKIEKTNSPGSQPGENNPRVASGPFEANQRLMTELTGKGGSLNVAA